MYLTIKATKADGSIVENTQPVDFDTLSERMISNFINGYVQQEFSTSKGYIAWQTVLSNESPSNMPM